MLKYLSASIRPSGEISQRSRQNALSVLISILETAVAVILTAVLSRLLPAESFGTYSVIISALFMFGILAQLGLGNVIMLESSKSKNGIGEETRQLWYNADLMAVPTLLMAAAGLSCFLYFSDMSDVTPFSIMAAITQLIFFSILGLRSGALQGYGQANFAHLIMCAVPASFAAAAMLVLWWLGYAATLNTALWCYTCGLMVASMALHWRRSTLIEKASGRPSRDVDLIARLRKLRLPVAGMALVGIFTQTDIVMLGLLADPIQAGYYSAALKVAAFLAVVRVRLTLVSNHLVPPLFARQDFAGIQNTCRSVAATAFGLSLTLVAANMMWGEDIIVWLYGPEFIASAPIFTIMLVAYSIAAAFGMSGGVLIMTGNAAVNFKVSCVSAALNIILNPIAIYLYGAVGAALTMAFSVTVSFAVMSIILRRMYGIDVSIFGYFRKPALVQVTSN